ncbi:MAG: MaoC family dehydratase N-terminal domain-containing protein [Chloroflexi bacterium]|nr:MaoC family dehydratase N-terminal domain-containing protein [Chloroflexota bacterium]MBU1749013.1 MaoC family dehydratase N-terminal domain-containing protein [Chloroflexota bacterium]
MAEIQVRGRYFDELEVGDAVNTPARTMTETDVVMFAAISGDFNQLHTDEVFASAGAFGARVTHGMLVLSVATGLVGRAGVFEGTAIGFTNLEWKFKKPVYIGDTIRVRAEVVRKRPLGKEAGFVFVKAEVLNQKDEVVQAGEWRAIVAQKPKQE